MFCLFSRGFYGLSTDQLSWRTKYVPTILSESLAQARVAGTLRAKTERKIWITYSGLPSPPRDVTGKNVLIHFAEKNYQISLYNVF